MENYSIPFLPLSTELESKSVLKKLSKAHKALAEATGMKVFFCHAYHSWEKGTVENAVGRIRRFLPKGESLDQITDQEIAFIEWKLNNTPRKCLQFLTPYESICKILKKE